MVFKTAECWKKGKREFVVSTIATPGGGEEEANQHQKKSKEKGELQGG